MQLFTKTFAGLLLVALLASPAATAQNENEKGFRPLFNGKDLTIGG